MAKALAVMTSGGDAPGMNAAIRAVVRRGLDCGLEIHGVFNGYEGLVEGGECIRRLKWEDVGGNLQKGGTFLGTARSERFRTEEGRRQAVSHLLDRGIDALVVIGGDGSLMGAHVLASEWASHVRSLGRGMPVSEEEEAEAADVAPLQVIGLPGSIDNDLYGTNMSIGADTALNHIVRALDDLSSTAASHQRTFVVETMGRHCGYLALMAGLAGGASWVLVPEEEMEVRWHQKMIETLGNAREIGRPHQMVMVAEGARHPDGLSIRSEEIRNILGTRLGADVRLTVLGHIQRGGPPTAFDRILATRLGVGAVDRIVSQPDVPHCHMLGLVKNEIEATPLAEVVEKSQRIWKEIEEGNYARALELRGGTFQNSLRLVKTLTRITPAREKAENGSVLVLTGGADSPGMNAAVSVAARCLLNQGVSVFGARDAFPGLIQGNILELDWHELLQWIHGPGSELGTGRYRFTEEDYPRIAENLRKYNIKGLVAIGGWGTYLKVANLVEHRESFDAFNLPMVLIPATIDNNLPCTEFSIGVDTALNNIVDAVDKIRHTAGATRRTFVVEVMGRQCGFLALMSALASGAEKAYLPETGVDLEELLKDVHVLKESFAGGKRLVIYLRNEHSSRHYTTDFIRRLLEEESRDQFEVRTAILGHVQRGGIPTAFDRILASRMGSCAAFALLEAMRESKIDVQVLGLSGAGVSSSPLSQALQEMDLGRGRPKRQWFMDLMPIAESLAKHGPSHVCS